MNAVSAHLESANSWPDSARLRGQQNVSLKWMCAERCADFVASFEDPRMERDPVHDKKKYMRMLVSGRGS